MIHYPSSGLLFIPAAETTLQDRTAKIKYAQYETMVETLGVKLVGWPKGVRFNIDNLLA